MYKIQFIFTLVAALYSSMASAVTVPDLYTADVAVDSYAAQAFKKAAMAGVAQVLVKVSGNSEIMRLKPVKAQLNEIEPLLQKYSYHTQANTAQARQLILRLEFDPARIRQVLQNAEQRVWVEQRPLVVVWTVFNDNDEHSSSGNKSSEGDFMAILKNHADQRGLPLVVPVFDLEEVSQLYLDDFDQIDLAKVQLASKRYGGTVTLLGKIQSNSIDQWSAHWVLLSGDEKVTWNLSGDSAAAVMVAGIDTVADTLATHAAEVDLVQPTGSVTLMVDKVQSIRDYVEVAQYLQNLSSVKAVQVLSVNADEVVYQLDLGSSQQSLIRSLALNSRLVPVANNITYNQQLQYRLAL